MNARIRLATFLAAALLSGAALGGEEQDSLAKFLSASRNPHISLYSSVLSGSIWSTRKIYVCWENPDPAYAQQMELVRQAVAATWERESALEFAGWVRCAAVHEGVRIVIVDVDGSGPHTKALGRQLNGMRNGMELNFTFEHWSSSWCRTRLNECITGIAVHEFGHALGFTHEHNRADRPGECMDPPQGTTGDLDLTPYDPQSVMNYCNANPNNNGVLSYWDKDTVGRLYGSPAERVNAARRPLQPSPVR